MKQLIIATWFLFLCTISSVGQTSTVTLASDGLPTGSNTAEGAACDLTRSFINSDVSLLTNSCLKRWGFGATAAEYDRFIKMVVSGTEADKHRSTSHPSNPASIERVYAAEHLTAEGPASYAYAMFNVHDVVFVDVVARLHDNRVFTNRTMVLKLAKGYWRVHPCPTIDPLLSVGLNSEPASTTEVQRKTP
jgi:hypothetical protein